MKNILSFMVSADWHIGATDPYRFKQELLTLVKETLEERKALDLFVVAGDTFDMKESLSSDSVKVFFLIMAELLELTKDYQTQFRFIEGTRTHDALQLSTLKIVFENLLQNNRVKFIEEVSKETFLETEILYIPEEYILDKEIYYKEFFQDNYDLIFGHGNTDVMWYMNQKEKQPHSAAPVFETEELCNLANYVYFGHYHYQIKVPYDNHVFTSLGPVTRWEFGKEGPCGIYYIDYDKQTNLAAESYIENSYAPILPTVKFSIKKPYELDQLNQAIRKRIDPPMTNADKVRLSITIDTSIPNYITLRDFILASYGNLDSLNLTVKLIGETETKEEETELVNTMDEKPYLYDKSMHDEARIAAFIRKKEGVNIPIENIIEVIRKKDTKIRIRED